MQSYENFVTSATSGISVSRVKVVFDKFLFLVKVRAFHVKQLIACLSKRLISITVYIITISMRAL